MDSQGAQEPPDLRPLPAGHPRNGAKGAPHAMLSHAPQLHRFPVSGAAYPGLIPPSTESNAVIFQPTSGRPQFHSVQAVAKPTSASSSSSPEHLHEGLLGKHTRSAEDNGHSDDPDHPGPVDETRTSATKRSRRRKATRACLDCQRAHLTCDDGRPCQRCIKRGIGTTCRDGIRKTAKYLLEDDNADTASPSGASSAPGQKDGHHPSSSPQLLVSPSVDLPTSQAHSGPMLGTPEYKMTPLDNLAPTSPNHNTNGSLGGLQSPGLFNLTLPHANYGFGSESTNLEYGMLGNILNNAALSNNATAPSADPSTGLPGVPMADISWQNINVNSLDFGLGLNLSYPVTSSGNLGNGPTLDSLQATHPTVDKMAAMGQVTTPTAVADSRNMAALGYGFPVNSVASSQVVTLHPTGPTASSDVTMNRQPVPDKPATNAIQAWMPTGTSENPTTPPTHQVTVGLTSKHHMSTGPSAGFVTVQPVRSLSKDPITINGTYRSSSDVYAYVREPFRYVDGFHFLMRLINDRLSKEDAIRICRAMSLFRPTFIALNMHLTTEDLVFMEKCFHRTLLEYEKLISFSGTPTVVWRRTGEIALVGKEFALLTGWSKEQLLGMAPMPADTILPTFGNGRTGTSPLVYNTTTNLPGSNGSGQSGVQPPTSHRYIFEFMDNSSVVDYWEKFAEHSYGNSEHSVMTTCQLLRPDNRKVPCTFCFTIKRAIFDIPLVIVGNFLPILS
ncbi:Transcriptional regulator of nonfermentable carbon utilization [Dispira simplex]|nr:Transcriptional regulator of nonfermentable carbon utilization [Dispira simplex]